jgi:U3 small nucleolar RNA-associated protein 25
MDVEERDIRDQGFTRPSVLVLLPTRGTCHRFVKDLYRLSGAPIDQEQEDRFDADYGELIDEDDEDEAMEDNPKKAADKKARRKAVLENKGREWNEYFGETANQDDDFKIGISLIPKSVNKGGKNKSNGDSNVSIRLYSDFFKSDIIVASPLGLRMLLTPDGGDDGDDDDSEDGNGKNRKGNSDYLSSIEICLLQHSEMILMQNWDHVNEILSLLNKDPVNNNATDFSRVRNYLLDGQGARWRQLILSTKFWDPTLLSTFKRFGKSLSGQVKVRRKIRDADASVSRVLVPIKQVFQKIPTGTFAQQSKARVDYFIKNLWPQLQKNDQKHTLVFIPSYFDFCSLRNALLKLEQKHLFVSVTEYSRVTEIGRGRARFLQGRKPLMLYTGRAHYFHRHAIKGVHNLVVLGLPEHPEFYADCVNLIQTGGGAMDDADDGQHRETSCLALFTKYEAHALERIVGSGNASRMVSSQNSTFMFYS